MDLEKFKNSGFRMLFEEVKTDDGAPAGGAAASGSDDPSPAPEDDASAGDPPAVYRPQGLPDHIAGATDKETMDNMFKAWKGARDELAGKKNVPEKLDDYKIELPEDIAKMMIKPGEDGKDQVFEHMRAKFHAKGIDPAAAAEIMSEFSAQVQEALKSNGTGDPAGDFEYKAFGGQDNAQPIIDAHKTFITGLQNSGKISAETASELELLTYHSEGMKALNELRSLLGDKPVPADLQGKQNSGEISEAQLNARVADPRYRPSSKTFDPAFRAETDRLFDEFYGSKKSA